MGRTNPVRATQAAAALGFLLGALTVYHKTKLRLHLTKKEAECVLDALDTWIEGYAEAAEAADDSEVPELFDAMATTVDVRRRLWRRMNVY